METKQCVRCGYYCNVTSFKKTGKWRINTCRWCKNDERKDRWHNIEKDSQIAETNKNRVKQWRVDNKDHHSEICRTWRNSTDKGYWNNKITSIRANCRTRGLDCLISRKDLEELYDKQNGKCVLTGRELIKTRKKSELDTCSVDRIDNNQGYTNGNIRLITLQANFCKSYGTDKELLTFCQDVINHLSLFD